MKLLRTPLTGLFFLLASIMIFGNAQTQICDREGPLEEVKVTIYYERGDVFVTDHFFYYYNACGDIVRTRRVRISFDD